jgi:hypothetical protein
VIPPISIIRRLRPCSLSRIVWPTLKYKLPLLLTCHAYNELGNPCGSLYTWGYNKLTLHRPGGVGGRPWEHYFPDVHDPSSPRQTFWHWDAPFIRRARTQMLRGSIIVPISIYIRTLGIWNLPAPPQRRS